ncbi:stellacyanin-like [Dioscorea cayenensis subsp. rotundata]|uniref:Stellacyanin-like n=1 Tax=Dioscorea cayennensis subsp. rotundata TaxID=55577 RepID=A0AB40CMX0_DIOCR|nr:stellacyanin-like [Dioscorea cayenensis subsp. rotundata]
MANQQELLSIPSLNATLYIVGDTAGWDISANLWSWTTNKTFHVGDVLLFQYSRYHSLMEVNKEGFDTCNTSNSILTSNTGNTSITLTEPGDKYFVCGVLSHCLGGMKLNVHVNGDGSSSGPAPAVLPKAGVLSPPSLPPPPVTNLKNNDSPFASASFGHLHGARGSLFFTWILCAIISFFLLILV